MNVSIIYGLFFSMLTVVGAFAQNRLQFKAISLDQGLSQSSVASIAEDAEGFLWFGTNDGLNRYDGYGLTVYRFDPQDSASLSNNFVLSICKDKDNALWIGTRGGVNRFDCGTNGFVRFIDSSDKKNILVDNVILSMMDDPKRNDVLWLGTPRGLKKFDKRTGTFTTYRPGNGAPDAVNKNSINSLCSDRAGRICLGTGTGVYRFDPEREIFTKIDVPLKGYAEFSVQAMYVDRSGTLWAGTESLGLIGIGEKDAVRTYRHDKANLNSLSNNGVYSILEDHAGHLWVGTYGGGLERLDVTSGTFLHSVSDPNVPSTLSNNEVRSIYEDKSNNLWCGTWGGGVNRLSANQEKFEMVFSSRDQKNALSGIIYSVCEDRLGDRWFGSSTSGLHRIEKQTNQFFSYRNETGKPGGIGGNFVIAIYEDKGGTMWIGTTTGGLDRFDRKTQTFRNYRHIPGDPQSIGYNNIQAILEDREGRFWIGTFGGGLDEFDRTTGTFTHYRHDDRDEFSLSSNVVAHLYEDRAGDLWVATSAGLNRFDKTEKRFTVYTSGRNALNGSSADYVYCIYEDRESGQFWLGTGGGLTRFDKERGAVRTYDEKDGLNNSTVYGILGDAQGGLWMSTNKGIARFDLRSETFRNYDKEDGLQSNEFNQGAFFKNARGEMLFGGINGVSVFHPDSIRQNPYVPPVVLTSFRKLGREAPVSLCAVDELDLSYRDNAFSFEFASLDFTNPLKNAYAYKMENFDKDWNFTDAGRRFAVYTNLDPGDYTFRVKGSNNDGIWNEAGTSVRIRIAPAFWQTWWFRLLMLVAAGLIIRWLYAVRVAYLLKVERLRSQIAADLHDDIGSTLTNIGVHAELIRSGRAEKDKMKLLEDIENMAREVMNSMSDIVWSIDARHDRYADLRDRMYDFAFKGLSLKNIKLTIADTGLDKEYLSPELRQNLYLIFKEAVNNVVKHSEGVTLVKVDLVQADGHLEMVIRDNGNGISPGYHAGHGLRNMQRRASRLNGHLEIFNDHGTVIKLIAPVGLFKKGTAP